MHYYSKRSANRTAPIGEITITVIANPHIKFRGHTGNSKLDCCIDVNNYLDLSE